MGRGRAGRLAAAALACAAIVATGTATASAREYAPLGSTRAQLTLPEATLRAALTCTGDLSGAAAKRPVLLVPGTTLRPDVQYRETYDRAFDRDGRPHCDVTLPDNANGDIQTSAEYVVHALRFMSRRSGGGKVDVVGHSQGGMLPRWVLRFFPDTRALVDDLVGLAASNHGTLDSQVICQAACPPAFWQQRTFARFTKALNSRTEVFPGIEYTQVYTRLDEVVTPNLDPFTGSTSLRATGPDVANLAVQDGCPNALAEHLAVGTTDPTAYAYAVDALDHDGPARLSRIPRTVCAQLTQPGITPAEAPAFFTRLGAFIAQSVATAPQTPAEPPLREYVFAP